MSAMTARVRARARDRSAAGNWSDARHSAREVGPLRRIAKEHAEHRAGESEEEMRPEAPPFVNIFPAEENEIFLEDAIDLSLREVLADGAAVFVIDDAARLVQDFPAALPGLVAEVGVFEIEGPEQLVESAELQKLAAIECAGSASAVKARERAVIAGSIAMADAQSAVFPPALREPGFFAQLVRIAEENLARDGEDFFVGESRRAAARGNPAARACRC